MKKCGLVFAALLAIWLAPLATAATAVKIDIGSDGRAIDSNAIRTVRGLVALGISNNIVDSFYVFAPRVGGPIPREGGLSACAEKGFTATERRFNAMVARLKAVRARAGTFINLETVATCTSDGTVEPQACGGIAGLQCPSGQFCADDPSDSCDPANGGADCSGICQVDGKVCTQDVKSCPDGSFVSRQPPSCAFAPCPATSPASR